MKLRLGLAQIHIIHGNTRTNLERAISLIKSAAGTGSSIILFPELFSSGFDMANLHSHASQNELFLKNLASLLSSLQISVGGTLVEKDNQGNMYNTFYFLQPNQPPIHYRKIHLFKPLEEEQWFKPGTNLVTANWENEIIGLSICYDLRFPELFRRYALKGCKLFLLSAEFPLSRIEQWKILTQARAIENQAFIAAVNCVGETGSTIYGGSSIIVNPSGSVIVEGNTNEEALLYADIDLDDAANLRHSFPVLSDCRPEAYN